MNILLISIILGCLLYEWISWQLTENQWLMDKTCIFIYWLFYKGTDELS